MNVAPIIKDVLDNIKKESIINSFISTGLCPLNPDRVDYQKCLDIDIIEEEDNIVVVEPEQNNNISRCNSSEVIPVSERYTTAKSVLLELLPKQTISDVIDGKCDNVLISTLWRDLNDRIGDTSNGDTQKLDTRSSISTGLSEDVSEDLDAAPLEDFHFVDFVETVNPDTNSSENITPPDDETVAPDKNSSENITPPDVSYKHVFWDGKIQYKKKKAPAERLPAMISGKRYRSLVLDKVKGAKRKKKSDDWTCVYCKKLYSEDITINEDKTWVECDKCNLTMHFECIPSSHVNNYGFDIHNIGSDDVKFHCESCSN